MSRAALAARRLQIEAGAGFGFGGSGGHAAEFPSGANGGVAIAEGVEDKVAEVGAGLDDALEQRESGRPLLRAFDATPENHHAAASDL